MKKLIISVAISAAFLSGCNTEENTRYLNNVEITKISIIQGGPDLITVKVGPYERDYTTTSSAHISGLKVGDKIDIEYNKHNRRIIELEHSKEEK